MNRGFYHPDRGYWETIGDAPKNITDKYPEGTIEVPIKPGAGYEFDGVQWVAPDTAAIAVAELEAWRVGATLSKAQFCLRANTAGLLTDDEMVIAAKGEWPQAFSDAFAGLPPTITEKQAQAVWAAVSVVYRNDPVLNAVAAAKGIPPETLDAMFGWQG